MAGIRSALRNVFLASRRVVGWRVRTSILWLAIRIGSLTSLKATSGRPSHFARWLGLASHRRLAIDAVEGREQCPCLSAGNGIPNGLTVPAGSNETVFAQ